jgi:hypothetical protein
MSFSKSALVVLAASLTFTAVSAHADSFTTGGVYSGSVPGNSSAGELTFSFDGSTESGGGGNFTGSTGVVNGKPVAFTDVFCVDLLDQITTSTTYNATYSTSGVINGKTVNNAGEIAWLISNLAPSATTQAENEGLQAAIWEVEYGSSFSLILQDNSSAIDSAYASDLTALGSKTAAVNSVLWVSPENSNGSNSQGQVIYDPSTTSPVPEPGTLCLFGTGLLGLSGLVRHRFSRSVA